MADNRIQFLIDNLQESLDVEVKNWLGGLQTADDQASLAKEIIALANHGGGHIFIGFIDEGASHPEIAPEEGEAEAFTQDTISNLVAKYITPPIQCSVVFHSPTGSDILHPVIVVPASQRTPVWAARGSPDSSKLKNSVIYVRRPGGNSEPPRSQDDWERLLDRLLRTRQSDLLDAMRGVLNPKQFENDPAESLEDWEKEGVSIWQSLTEPLPFSDRRKLEEGYWTFSFAITPFPTIPLNELNAWLSREAPKLSGWPPFAHVTQGDAAPIAHGDEIRAWLARDHSPETLITGEGHADFWRLTDDGRGFALRPYMEDLSWYLQNRHPRPEGKSFDWTFPTELLTEFLMFVSAYAGQFAAEESDFSVLVHYYETQGRTLEQYRLTYGFSTGQRCSIPEISSSVSGKVSEIETNLSELILQILAPVYGQFEFASLSKATVDALVQRQLGRT